MRPPERAGANKCEKKKKKKKKGGRGDDVEATLAERRRQNRCTFFLEQKNRYERTNEARHHRLPLPNYYFFFLTGLTGQCVPYSIDSIDRLDDLYCRYCNSCSVKGTDRCGHHREVEVRPRVRCPVDPSHTCFKDELEKHVLRCNATKRKRELEKKKYFCQDVNLGEESLSTLDVPASERKRVVLGLSGEELRSLVSRVHASVASLSADLGYAEPEDDPSLLLRPEECSPWFGLGEFSGEGAHQLARKYKARHVSQQASIIGNTNAFAGKGDRDVCLLELGAGKGYLGAMWVQSMAYKTLVLVDNQCFKFKADREVRKDNSSSVSRLECDLKDLDVTGIEEVAASDRCRVVGTHLCGGATDLALEISANLRSLRGKAAARRLDCLGIATCCHHRCTWRAFVAREIFLSLGFSAHEFQLVSWMTGWAVCGHGNPKEAEAEARARENDTDAAGHPLFGMMTREERMAAGRACKRLLDLCRARWLREKGMAARYVKYAPQDVTGENMMLLAK